MNITPSSEFPRPRSESSGRPVDKQDAEARLIRTLRSFLKSQDISDTTIHTFTEIKKEAQNTQNAELQSLLQKVEAYLQTLGAAASSLPSRQLLIFQITALKPLDQSSTPTQVSEVIDKLRKVIHDSQYFLTGDDPEQFGSQLSQCLENLPSKKSTYTPNNIKYINQAIAFIQETIPPKLTTSPCSESSGRPSAEKSEERLIGILNTFLKLENVSDNLIDKFNKVKEIAQNTQNEELKTLLAKVENKFKAITLGKELNALPPLEKKQVKKIQTSTVEPTTNPSAQLDPNSLLTRIEGLLNRIHLNEGYCATEHGKSIIEQLNLYKISINQREPPRLQKIAEHLEGLEMIFPPLSPVVKRKPPPPPPVASVTSPPAQPTAPLNKSSHLTQQQQLEVDKHYMTAINRLFNYYEKTAKLKRFMIKVRAGNGLQALMKKITIKDPAVKEEVERRLQNAIDGVEAINRIPADQHHKITARPNAYTSINPSYKEKAIFDSQELLLDLFKVAGDDYHLFATQDPTHGLLFAISKADKIEGYTNIPRTNFKGESYETRGYVKDFRDRCRAYRQAHKDD